MRNLFVALSLLAIALNGVAAPAASIEDIKSKLLAMGKDDQDALRNKALTEEQTHDIFRQHTVQLKAIVRDHGWPKISEVGEDASQDAWLLVQHADDDRNWQWEALKLMEPLAATGEIKGSNIAYLKDRLSVAESKPQPYGTQGGCGSDGIWKPFSMLEPEHVDERRLAMKMEPLKDYIEMATRYMCKRK